MDWLIAINSLRLKTSRVDFNQQNPVEETHFGRPWCQRHRSGRVCLVIGHTSSPRGPSFQTLTLPGGVRFIVWRLRRLFTEECRRGPRHFLEYRTRLGYVAAPGLTLKKTLCHTCPDGGMEDKYRWFQSAESSWWDTLRPAVVSTARIWSGVSRLLT